MTRKPALLALVLAALATPAACRTGGDDNDADTGGIECSDEHQEYCCWTDTDGDNLCGVTVEWLDGEPSRIDTWHMSDGLSLEQAIGQWADLCGYTYNAGLGPNCSDGGV